MPINVDGVMEPDEEVVHEYFELSYAAYLVLPRSILQSMPNEWQKRFVGCLEELQVMCMNAEVETPDYEVQAKRKGKFCHDPFRDYERGRRRVDLTSRR